MAATVLMAAAIVAAGPAVRPAMAEELTPAASFAVRLADRIPAEERKQLVAKYRRIHAQLPPDVTFIGKPAIAPPVCRSAFPPGLARDLCAQMIEKIRKGAKVTAKCSVGIVAVVARPTVKTVALLAKSCGPPVAALAVGAVAVFLNKKCRAITPKFIEFTCDLLF
jgi:hypothetical protein